MTQPPRTARDWAAEIRANLANTPLTAEERAQATALLDSLDAAGDAPLEERSTASTSLPGFEGAEVILVGRRVRQPPDGGPDSEGS